MQPVTEQYRRGGRGKVYVYDASRLPWQDAGRSGISQRVIRRDDQRGQHLGIVGMEPMTSSGLHQHQGTATSYFVDGGLTDYQGSALPGQVGVNLKGATHDAIAYRRVLFVARMEAPVTYPPAQGPLHGLHAGARLASFVNPAPDVMPDINVCVDAVAAVATDVDGVRRQMLFDYAGTGDHRRLLQLSMRPQSWIPVLQSGEAIEFWVRGGAIEIDRQRAHANCFVIIEPGAEFSLSSEFGALLLVWAEGPPRWADGRPRRDPFGFD